MTIRPRDLPKRRNQILKHLSDPNAAIRARTHDSQAPGLDALARHLRAAEFYWVAKPMAALAMSAGAALDTIDANPVTRPSGCGFALFEDGIGDFPLSTGWLGLNAGGKPHRVPLSSLPVSAMSWGPYEGEALVWAFTDRRQLNSMIAEYNTELVESEMPPLIPVAATTVPHDPVTPEGAPLGLGPVVQCLVASWLMMQQPQLADRERAYPDKSTRGTTMRLGMPDPEVSIIDLRKRYHPDDREETGVEGGRRFRHRWVVSGHWRDQPYGPDRTLRRKQWIAAYVKGPDGAPLLATERVNVWRR